MNTSPRPKILIAPSTFAELDSAPIDLLRSKGFELIDNPFKRRLTKEEVIKLLKGIDGIIAGLEPLDKEVLQSSKLKVISRCGSGTSNVYANAKKEFDIEVRSTKGAPTTSVAELTICAMLNLLRQFPQMNADLHQGKWSKKTGLQLEGKTVVIIGFGDIGKKVATLLKPFQVTIIAVDPNIKSKLADKNHSLNKALPQADIITIHASGDTQILGKEEFKLIKSGAFLLNASRGEVLDEQCLIEALQSKQIQGAWIDTFTVEPYTGPLKDFPQVLLTPHAGSYTEECRKRMELQAAENLVEAFEKLNALL